MNKTILIPLTIAVAILLVAGAGVGGFFIGKSYESNRASAVRNNFLRDRGIQGFDPNAAPGQGQFFNQEGPNSSGGTFGRGASGEVKAIDGNTLTLTTGQKETKVTLSDKTAIVKSVSGTPEDIAAGQQVLVIGERDADGNIDASQVTILNGDLAPAGVTP